MARCLSCSAPLAANTNLCNYCKTRNDVDLHEKHAYSVSSKQSERICPRCDTLLQTVRLKLKAPFYIERCETCFGLFFDPGEIETLLESSVSNVFEINHKLIKSINNDRYQKGKKFSYVKCPLCRIFMNRVNFAHRSGVVIDQCKKHGIWLNSGEITHLMEWKKAGGELLHTKKEKQSKIKKQTSRPKSSINPSIFSQQAKTQFSQQAKTQETELFESVSSLVFKLFT